MGSRHVEAPRRWAPAVPALPPHVSMLALAPISAALGWAGYAVHSRYSTLWALHGVLFGALSLALSWDEPGPARRRRLTTTLLLTVVAFGVGALVGGATWASLGWRIPTNVIAVALGLAAYRWRGIGASFIPLRAHEAAWMMVCIGVVAGVGVLLGAYPLTELGGGDPATAAWSFCRAYMAMAVSVNCAVPLIFRMDASHLTPAPRAALVPLGIVAAVTIALPYRFPESPLSWLFVVPPLLAGLTLRLREAAGLMLLLGIAAAKVPYPEFAAPAGAWLPPSALINLAISFATHFTLLLVVFREQIARLQVEADRRAAAERDRHGLLTSVFEAMSDGVLLSDARGEVVLANPAARSLLGDLPNALALSRLQSTRCDALRADLLVSPPAETADPSDHVAHASAGPATTGPALEVSRRDLALGPEEMMLLLVKDVSDERAAQRDLESFAGTVAHDLKGPLTAVSAWMEAADDELEHGDVRGGEHAIGKAQGAVDRMRALIDDYLAYAVSRGGMLAPTDVPLRTVAEEIVEAYAGGDGAGLRPVFHLDTPHVLYADPALTRQVIANLVGNAVKYTREGEAAQVWLTSREVCPGWIEVAVADRGRGLQPGDEQRIFEAFSRSTKDAAAVQGIGLGLALCHAIVGRHGGHITAESNPDGGATFRFTLPASTAKDDPAPEDLGAVSAGRR